MTWTALLTARPRMHSQRRKYSAREAADAAASVRVTHGVGGRFNPAFSLLSRARRWTLLTRTVSLACEAPPHRAPSRPFLSIGTGSGLICPPSAVDRGASPCWVKGRREARGDTASADGLIAVALSWKRDRLDRLPRFGGTATRSKRPRIALGSELRADGQ